MPCEELRFAHTGFDMFQNRSWPGPEYLVKAPDGDLHGCVGHVADSSMVVGNGDAPYGRLADAVEDYSEQHDAEARDQPGSQLKIIDAAQDEHAQARR